MNRLIGLLVVIVIAAACTPQGPVVRISTGLELRMTPAEVEQLTIDEIRAMHLISPWAERQARVVSMTAIPGGLSISRHDLSASWIVEVDGTFAMRQMSGRGVHSSTSVTVGRHIRMLIADYDGTITSFAFSD